MRHALHRCLITALLGLVLAMVGCQTWPGSYAAGVDQLTVREKVRDARAQRITGWSGLRVDSAATDRLDAALASDDLDQSKRYAQQYLTQAHSLAKQSAAAEIRRLDDDAIAKLCDQYFPDQTRLSRAQLIAAFDTQADDNLAKAQRLVAQATSVTDLHQTLDAFDKATESPIKYRGKTQRILTWLPFYLPSKMVADKVEKSGPGCPLFLGGFDHADLYTPPQKTDTALDRYAPIFVIEQAASPSYDKEADRIGRVVALDADHVAVQTQEPAVYSYARQVLLHGREHEQLVYTAWFPEHPALSNNDPMAGHIDGLTVRVTLDRAGKPAIVETMANCGCFHGLYPARRLELAARSGYGPPPDGMSYALEKEEGNKLHTHIPALLDFKDAGARPVIYVAAGWHSIIHVALTGPENKGYATRSYTMSPYSALEQLKIPDGGYTSMFYDNGLVRHAQRPEGVYFTPLGILSAGQPRQRETQLIYFDRYDFDDPNLLDRLLHLPKDF